MPSPRNVLERADLGVRALSWTKAWLSVVSRVFNSLWCHSTHKRKLVTCRSVASYCCETDACDLKSEPCMFHSFPCTKCGFASRGLAPDAQRGFHGLGWVSGVLVMRRVPRVF